MKTTRFVAMILMSVFMMTLSNSVIAAEKNEKECVLSVEMDCMSCANKIEKNLKFEKGIKKIEVKFKEQEVHITYNSKKATPENYIKALQKLKFKAVLVEIPSIEE